MKRKRQAIALCLIVCMLAVGCSTRRAQKGLSHCPYVHTDGRSLVHNGQAFFFQSEDVPLNEDNAAQAETLIATAFEKPSVNTVRLCLDSTLLTARALTAQAEDILSCAFALGAEYEKYVIFNIEEYPAAYTAWYDDSTFRDDTAALWTAVAARCKDETYLAAYEVGHISRPSDYEDHNALEFWEEMMQRLTDAVRASDSQHLLIINTISPTISTDAYNGFPYIKDRNFMYAARAQTLSFYTDQIHRSTEDETVPQHLIYPNEFWVSPAENNYYGEGGGSSMSVSTTEYQTIVSDVFTPEEEGLYCRLGANVIPSSVMGGGELRIGSLTFYECTEDGEETKTVYRLDTTVGVPFAVWTSGFGNSDASVYDDGTAYLESIEVHSYMFVRDLYVPLESGKHYKLSVTLKQRGMSDGYSVTPCIYVYSDPNGLPFGKAYLSELFGKLDKNADEVGVPILFTGLHLSENADTADKGAARFRTDAAAAVQELGQHYSY